MLRQHRIMVLGKHDRVVNMREPLRKARTQSGLTQAQLAEMIGIDRSAYTHIELGDRDPSYEIAYRIGRALRRRVEDIILPVNVLQQRSQ